MPYDMPRSDARVLVLAPHPDDESLGCGGTVKLLTSRGTPCDILFLTRGELGSDVPSQLTPADQCEIAERRTAEALSAARELGADQVYFLGGKDGRLGEQLVLAEPLAGRLREGNYSRLFCPWSGELHPDHQAAFQLMKLALPQAPRVTSIWLYEVWTPLVPTNYVPIDSTIDAKRRAIEAHVSQLALLDYLGAFVGLAAYRGLQCPPTRHAEAFIVATRDAILKGERI